MVYFGHPQNVAMGAYYRKYGYAVFADNLVATENTIIHNSYMRYMISDARRFSYICYALRVRCSRCDFLSVRSGRPNNVRMTSANIALPVASPLYAAV